MEHKLNNYFKCSCGFLTMSYLSALKHIGVNTEKKTTNIIKCDMK